MNRSVTDFVSVDDSNVPVDTTTVYNDGSVETRGHQGEVMQTDSTTILCDVEGEAHPSKHAAAP